jgi:hypothetical protein
MPFVVLDRMLRAVLVVLVLAPSIVHADPPGSTPSVSPPGLTPESPAPVSDEGTPSYSGWILAADGTAIGMLTVAIKADDEGWAKLSLATYVLGAPLVHAFHGRGGYAGASLCLRVGLPFAGAMLMAAGSNAREGDVVYGAVIGGVAAAALDAVFLAKGEPPKRPRAAWTPTVRSTQGGFAVGAATHF